MHFVEVAFLVAVFVLPLAGLCRWNYRLERDVAKLRKEVDAVRDYLGGPVARPSCTVAGNTSTRGGPSYSFTFPPSDDSLGGTHARLQ